VTADALDITEGTNARLNTSDGIGEVGVGTFALQVTNSAGSALKPIGFRAEDIRFATGSSERLRIDSSGNVLVGTTNNLPAISNVEGIALSAGSYGGRLEVSRDSNEPMAINRMNTGNSLVAFKKDGTTVGSISSRGGSTLGLILNPASGTGAGLSGTTNAIFPVNETTTPVNGVVSLGTSSNAFKDAYLSGGVYLGGTVAANLLDDYEFGTWNPHIKDTHDGSTLVTATGQGKYTKIGNLLTINFNVYANGVSATATGVPYFELPFTVSGANSEGGMMLPGYVNGCGIRKSGYLVTGSSQLRLGTVVENPYGNAVTGGSFSGSVRWYGTFTFRVA
jgi:hypothetical protein